jgi:hypothetical protein
MAAFSIASVMEVGAKLTICFFPAGKRPGILKGASQKSLFANKEARWAGEAARGKAMGF